MEIVNATDQDVEYVVREFTAGELLRQALARGYTTERNAHKILDADLIEDMALEVEKWAADLPMTTDPVDEEA